MLPGKLRWKHLGNKSRRGDLPVQHRSVNKEQAVYQTNYLLLFSGALVPRTHLWPGDACRTLGLLVAIFRLACIT